MRFTIGTKVVMSTSTSVKRSRPSLEKRLLDEVFIAAKRTGGLLNLLDCVSQKRHRPVKMMKLEPFGSRDQIILSPTLSSPITAAGKESVQHSEIDRPRNIKLVMASL